MDVTEKDLRIDEHALEEALLDQPSLFYHVSREVALLVSQRDAAKQELQEIEALVDAEIRHDFEVSGDKITEKQVESAKLLDKRVKIAKRKLSELNEQLGLASALKEAFSQRAYALKDLVALYVANYYGQDTERPARQTKDVDSRIAKEAMNKHRRERR
jgi:hypothetical protein